jgi:hypothetical protein
LSLHSSEATQAKTFRARSSPAPTQIKPQPAPAILGQESVHTTLSITHHTKERPSPVVGRSGPQRTHHERAQSLSALFRFGLPLGGSDFSLSRATSGGVAGAWPPPQRSHGGGAQAAVAAVGTGEPAGSKVEAGVLTRGGVQEELAPARPTFSLPNPIDGLPEDAEIAVAATPPALAVVQPWPIARLPLH